MASIPQFYLTRPGRKVLTPSGGLLAIPGANVPLIPLDLLPECFEIFGIPRALHDEHTLGLTNLGVVPRPAGRLDIILHDVSPAAPQQQQQPPELMPGDLIRSQPLDEIRATAAAGTAPPDAREVEKRRQGLAGSIHNRVEGQTVAVEQQPQQRQTTDFPQRRTQATHPVEVLRPVAAAKRRYCRHWCQHGVCRYGTACVFHHAMPATPEGLAEVGLREFPRWWTAATGLAPATTARRGRQQQQQHQKQEDVRDVQMQDVVVQPGHAISHGAGAHQHQHQQKGHVVECDSDDSEMLVEL